MAISIVGGTAVGAASSTTITKPTGVQSGDLILILISTGSTSPTVAPTPPTGFTTIDTDKVGTTGVSWSVTAYKVAGGSEPASYTWTAGDGSSPFNVWSCIALRGQDGTTPIDAHDHINSITTSLALAALTATVAGDTLVIMQTDQNDVAVTSWPTGVTEYAAASNPTGNGVDTGTKASLASGSTGALSITTGANPGNNQAFGILVKAPAAGGTNWSQSLGPDAQSALDSALWTFGKSLLDPFSELESLTKTFGKHSLSDFLSGTDQFVKFAGKNLTQDALSGTDQHSNNFGKGLSEATSAQDSFSRIWQAHLTLLEGISQLDALAKMPAKRFLEWVSEVDSVTAQRVSATNWVQNLTDTHSALDVLLKTPGKWNKDAIAMVDLFSRVWTAHLALQDWVAEADTWLKQAGKSQQDSQSGQDNFSRQVNYVRTFVDSLSETEKLAVGKLLLLRLLDAAGLTDQVSTLIQHPIGQFALAQVISLVATTLGMHISLLVGSGLSQFLSLLATPLSQVLVNF